MIGTEAKGNQEIFLNTDSFFVPHCAACGTSLTRGQTLAPCSGSAAWSTGSRGSPRTQILYCNVINAELHLCQTIAVHWVLNAPNGPPFCGWSTWIWVDGLLVILEFTPRSSIDPSGLVISVCSNSLREGTSLSGAEALDFLPWPCRCFPVILLEILMVLCPLQVLGYAHSLFLCPLFGVSKSYSDVQFGLLLLVAQLYLFFSCDFGRLLREMFL